MTITASDVKFKKPVTITDTGTNGGRKGQVLVVSGARHSLFPRVTKTERTAGVVRYRKEFWCNENASDEEAYDVMLFLETQSRGDDYFTLGLGTQTDEQTDIVATPPFWIGCGTLNTALSGGETSVVLLMEDDSIEFQPGGYIHLSNKVLVSQTMDTDVRPGDSCELVGGTWEKRSPSTDIADPYGIYLGSNSVLSETAATKEEFLQLDTNLTTDEDIGTGDGASQTPALTDLAAITNGLVTQYDYRPVITVLCGAVLRTVYIDDDGTCSGYCSAGEINLDTGVWTTDITWTTAPDNTEDILITYYDKNYSYSGNVVTIATADAVANAYTTAATLASGVLLSTSVIATVDDWAETSTSGTYDETTYPVTIYNDGTEEDTITITMASATTFNASGANAGSLGTGLSISSDFSPTNPDTGQPYFTLLAAGWGGTWAAAETIVFDTHPSALPFWWKEDVPAGATAESDNLSVLGWYSE